MRKAKDAKVGGYISSGAGEKWRMADLKIMPDSIESGILQSW